MDGFRRGDEKAELNKDIWFSRLDSAYRIYSENELENGVVLVNTLRQLVKCVSELAEYRKVRLHVKGEKLGKCYDRLIDVSNELDGALKVIAEHSAEAIYDYSKKQGMNWIGRTAGESPKFSWITEFRTELVGIIATAILAAVADIIFKLDLLSRLIGMIQSIFGTFSP